MSRPPVQFPHIQLAASRESMSSDSGHSARCHHPARARPPARARSRPRPSPENGSLFMWTPLRPCAALSCPFPRLAARCYRQPFPGGVTVRRSQTRLTDPRTPFRFLRYSTVLLALHVEDKPGFNAPAISPPPACLRIHCLLRRVGRLSRPRELRRLRPSFLAIIGRFDHPGLTRGRKREKVLRFRRSPFVRFRSRLYPVRNRDLGPCRLSRRLMLIVLGAPRFPPLE